MLNGNFQKSLILLENFDNSRFSLDRASDKMIDFSYNLAKLVSRARFSAATAPISIFCSSWFNLTFSGQRIEVEKCSTGAISFLCFCGESPQ